MLFRSFQQRSVARAHRIPVDAVHVLTPVVVTHQPGVPAKDRLSSCSEKLYQFLSTHPKIHCLNQYPSTVLTFYLKDIDSHLLAEALSDQGIMVRSGYFCVHYYLDHKLKLPHLLRLSLGYQNTETEIDRVIKILSKF